MTECTVYRCITTNKVVCPDRTTLLPVFGALLANSYYLHSVPFLFSILTDGFSAVHKETVRIPRSKPWCCKVEIHICLDSCVDSSYYLCVPVEKKNKVSFYHQRKL